MGKNDQARKTYYELLAIQQKTIKQIKKTREAKYLDNFCRQKLKEAGLPNFGHSTGHGVGLEIHEYPKISFVSADTIQKNQVFTIEPGVYFPGQWGIRIEDTVMVSEDLAPVRLTKSPV
jgi:Xaa-Pro aminopeptidase